MKFFIYRVRLFARQTLNFFLGHQSTDKGIRFYDYCTKIIFENYEPKTFADTMFEDEIKSYMISADMNRHDSAMMIASTFASFMTPVEFAKRPYKVYGV